MPHLLLHVCVCVCASICMLKILFFDFGIFCGSREKDIVSELDNHILLSAHGNGSFFSKLFYFLGISVLNRTLGEDITFYIGL